MKGRFWADAEIWKEALPTNYDAEGRLTNIIRYFSFIPTRNLIHDIVHPVEIQSAFFENEETKAATKKLKTDLISKIAVEELDLQNKDQLKTALNSGLEICEGLRVARKELAEFIKSNFPLDKIMVQEQ
jgi:hypothetical protein